MQVENIRWAKICIYFFVAVVFQECVCLYNYSASFAITFIWFCFLNAVECCFSQKYFIKRLLISILLKFIPNFIRIKNSNFLMLSKFYVFVSICSIVMHGRKKTMFAIFFKKIYIYFKHAKELHFITMQFNVTFSFFIA